MTDWPPRVLSTVYGNRLQTFYDLLVDLMTEALRHRKDRDRGGGGDDHQRLRGAELRKEAGKRLIKEGDAAEYLTLLKNTYAVLSETAPTLGPVSFEQRWTQQQIVERVIVLQFRHEARPSNVLCSGYRKLRPSVGDSSRQRAPQGLECACENTSVDLVNSSSWNILLSRVGDLIMLHALSHAAIFTLFPNNCFLQISGVPTSSSVSTSRRSPCLHPGETMLGGVAHRKWMSEPNSAQQKQTGRDVCLSGVEHEGKNEAYYGDSRADNSMVVPDELKQGSDGNHECAGDKIIGIVRNLSSDLRTLEKSPKLEGGSPSLEISQRSNIFHSSHCKRNRTENTEFGFKTDVLQERNKHCDLGKGKLASKRKRCAPRQQICQNGEVSKVEMGNDFNDRASVSIINASVDIQARSSVASSHCSKRKGREAVWLKHSTVDNKMLVNDNDNDPDALHFSKRSKLTERSEKHKHCQSGKKAHVIADQEFCDLNAKVDQLSNCSKKPKTITKCSMGHGSVGSKHGPVPSHHSNHNHGDSLVVQDACPSQQTANASTSRKRIRPPSWKRRKLRRAQESCQDLVTKGHVGNAKQVTTSQLLEPPVGLDEETAKAGNEKLHVLVSGHQSRASGRADFGCSLTCGESTEANSFGSIATQKVPQRRKSLSDSGGTTSGMCQRLVDRAPIFYNSNYSCHPGLPAKHILNTTKPNHTGVAHLFSAIFGAHCNTSVCSSSGNHTYAIADGRFKSVHKLLKELLSNARRCAFARLLGRHCPLPQGFQSLPEDSNATASGPLLQSQTPKTEPQDSELVKGMHEDEQQECMSVDPGPVIEEILSLWLGPNYQPSGTATTTRLLGSTSPVQKEAPSPCKQVQGKRKFTSDGQHTVTGSVQKKQKQTNKYNAIESAVGDNNLRPEKTVQAELISSYTDHSKVVGFLWAVCRSIIPKDMLGSVRSWRALRSSIAHFVGLRRHEKFNVQHALFRLQVSGFSWLAFQCTGENNTVQKSSGRFSIEERELQQKRLELWLHWLFTRLVLPTIRAHFYVTENENHRQDVFYYRKPVWARIRSNGLKELTSKNYKKLSRQAVAQVLNSRVLGFSQIRLLPKRSSLRPIANLAASSQGTLKFRVQSQGQAKLRHVFGDISTELSPVDCSERENRILSFSHQIVPPVLEDGAQDAAVEAYGTSSSVDSKKDAIVTKYVGGCSDRGLVSVRDLSRSPRSGERLDLSLFVKAPQIRERSKKIVNFSFRSINSVLKDAHCCLKLEKEAHPHDLGSSVFGYCDIHAKVLPFILQLKGSRDGMPPLFMAVCDVTKAYDTIEQEKLQGVVEDFVQSSNYKVARYTCITPTLASVRVLHGRACTLADKPHKFVDSVHKLATKRSNCIFTDQGLSTSLRREQVLAVLEEHVKQNIVQIGAHFYQQTVGIPQGSVLSSLLCSLFYGHYDVNALLPLLQSHSVETSNHLLIRNSSLCGSTGARLESGPCFTSSIAKATGSNECDIEQMLEFSLDVSDKVEDQSLARKHVTAKTVPSACLEPIDVDICKPSRTPQHSEAPGAYEKTSVLMRLIDDSFFISTSEAEASTFVESMHRGSKEYGCQANERKTAVSFYLQLGNEVLPRKVYKTEDGACFMRWSGLLVNCYTLEFQADYTRYCGEHIRSTLTVRREKNQGWQLVLKMCQYMRPKCHALFFDPRINSPATIRLNAFQAFLLCAMKFHAYVCCLPHVMGSNQPFLYKAIDCAIRYMYGLLRHKMDTVGAKAVEFFPYQELEWLALVAFVRVLKRKQARHQILLHMLQCQLQMPKYNILSSCSHLLSATDERRSSMFKLIKY